MTWFTRFLRPRPSFLWLAFAASAMLPVRAGSAEPSGQKVPPAVAKEVRVKICIVPRCSLERSTYYIGL